MSQIADRLPGWDALAWVMGHNSRDVFEQRYDLGPEVVAWFKSLGMFQEMEDERMIVSDPTETDRAAHKSSLAVLIAEGEKLKERLERSGGLPNNERGITFKDFQAALDHLYNKQAMFHGGMTEDRKKEILSKVFNGEIA
jgi:hypothetical protein